ncbi:MAG TPA: carboxymuconolactone decarboxylase family protein [Verrucomicrobiae bacterium]|jgi:AhpD family alkylhydroperoxidase|nr:carboxymuconolactone decarboxylase family protein [Verrucomicrobiae bacterium]
MAARLPYLDRAQVPPEIQSLYDTLEKGSGRVLNIFRLMAHHARSLPPFHAWYPRLREGPLDLRLRYLAYVRASQLNRCRYCVTHNGAAGRKAGIPKEQLEALAEHRTSPLFSELERLVLAYADAMTTEVQVDGALVETLRRRLGPEALVQLTLTVAAANFTNRFNEALGTELEYEEIRHG